MASSDNNENNGNFILKPELSFEWIKYKKEKTDLTLTNKITQAYQTKPEAAVEEKNSSVTRDNSINEEMFKDDPEKERIYLWYNALFKGLEMTMEEFSKIIHIPDLIETEEFLFRHPPLRFGYLWRGKNLKFSEDTISKLQQTLQE